MGIDVAYLNAAEFAKQLKSDNENDKKDYRGNPEIREVNLSTPRPKGRCLLEVHPELLLYRALKGGASRGRTGEST